MWLEVWFRELCVCSSQEGDLCPGQGIGCDRSSVSVALYPSVWVGVSVCVLGGDPSLPGCIVSYGGHNGILWSPSRAWHRLTKLGEVCAFCEGTYTGWHLVMSLSYVCNVQRVYEGTRRGLLGDLLYLCFIYSCITQSKNMSFRLCYPNLLSHAMHHVRLSADVWNLMHPLMQHITSLH